MEKFRRESKCKPTALFLFLGCFFLLNWPLLSITAKSGMLSAAYLFLLWLGIILILSLFCWKVAANLCEEAKEDKNQ